MSLESEAGFWSTPFLTRTSKSSIFLTIFESSLSESMVRMGSIS